MTAPGNDGRRSIGQLIKELADGGVALVRQEAALARVEVTDAAKGMGLGTAMVAGGGVLALLGVLCLFAGVIMLAGDQWLRDRYWLSALIVTILAGAVAAFFLKRGAAALSPKVLAPEATVATLKEDKEWLKRQLTSGGTSR